MQPFRHFHVPWVGIAFFTIGAASTASAKPLAVYILAGQSNMQGYAEASTMPGMKADSSTRPLYDKLMNHDDTFRVFDDVWVAAVSGNLGEPVSKSGPLTLGFGGNLRGQPGVRGKHAMRFGPELGFGVTMREHLQEPILIIKTAWGGKSLRKDFLSPSGVKVVGGDAQTGTHYKKMCDHVHAVLADPGKHHPAYEPEQGFRIAGFVWFQGWNDMMGGQDPLYQATEERPAFAAYGDLLACFIRDVRQEFKAPGMPFVIGVIGTGGNPDSDDPFRAAMAAPASMPEFEGTVTAVRTAEYFDEKLGSLIDRGWRWQRPAWDPEKKYVELAAKLAPLQKELNEAKAIADQAERAAKQKDLNDRIQKITYTEDEIAYLAANRCNQGYHYFGSAKMLGRFGEAFAKAMIAMQQP